MERERGDMMTPASFAAVYAAAVAATATFVSAEVVSSIVEYDPYDNGQ